MRSKLWHISAIIFLWIVVVVDVLPYIGQEATNVHFGVRVTLSCGYCQAVVLHGSSRKHITRKLKQKQFNDNPKRQKKLYLDECINSAHFRVFFFGTDALFVQCYLGFIIQIVDAL